MSEKQEKHSKNIGMNLYCVSKKFSFLIMSDCFSLDTKQILYIFSELINESYLSSEKKETYEILVQLIDGTRSFESSVNTLRRTINAHDTRGAQSISTDPIC
jgi:fructose-1,6-bisphosphatase